MQAVEAASSVTQLVVVAKQLRLGPWEVPVVQPFPRTRHRQPPALPVYADDQSTNADAGVHMEATDDWLIHSAA